MMEQIRNNERTPLRADRLIKARFAHLSNSEIAELFFEKKVFQKEYAVKKNARISPGGELALDITEAEAKGTLNANASIPLDIAYEDDALLIVNKPPGMHTVPLRYRETGALMNAVRAHLSESVTAGGTLNAGSVNRLDYETSGLVLIAKTEADYFALKELFKSKQTEKEYLAIVYGTTPRARSMVDMLHKVRIGTDERMAVGRNGTEARASFVTLASENGISTLCIALVTGARHQLRAQLSSRGYPIIGDARYGGGDGRALKLHALSLTFFHPRTQQRMLITAFPPASFFERCDKKALD